MFYGGDTNELISVFLVVYLIKINGSTNTSSPYNSGVRITNDVLKFYKNNLNISN